MSCPTCDRGRVPTREEIESVALEYATAGADGGIAYSVAGEIRNDRLLACAECESLVFGVLCRECGCFVQIRSLNPNNTCPHPMRNRWE